MVLNWKLMAAQTYVFCSLFIFTICTRVQLKCAKVRTWAQNGNTTNDLSVVLMQSGFCDVLSVLELKYLTLFPPPSQVCDPLGGDDAVGAGLHRSDDGGDPGQHAAAAEGILHVPQPGRGIRGHRSAGWHCPQAAAGQRRPGAGPSPAAAHPHHQEVSAGSGICCQYELTAAVGKWFHSKNTFKHIFYKPKQMRVKTFWYTNVLFLIFWFLLIFFTCIVCLLCLQSTFQHT